jgi:two-component system response regulator HydG
VPAAALNPSRLSILVVEDHFDIAQMMVLMLRTLGHEAKAAPTVAAATEVAGKQEFDLLISDYSLPDGTGVDVLTKLKPIGLSRAILVTAFGRQFQKQAEQAGFQRYLVKPVELDDLRLAIDSVARDPKP